MSTWLGKKHSYPVCVHKPATTAPHFPPYSLRILPLLSEPPPPGVGCLLPTPLLPGVVVVVASRPACRPAPNKTLIGPTLASRHAPRTDHVTAGYAGSIRRFLPEEPATYGLLPGEGVWVGGREEGGCMERCVWRWG